MGQTRPRSLLGLGRPANGKDCRMQFGDLPAGRQVRQIENLYATTWPRRPVHGGALSLVQRNKNGSGGHPEPFPFCRYQPSYFRKQCVQPAARTPAKR